MNAAAIADRMPKEHCHEPLIGLAALARIAFSGGDFSSLGARLLERAAKDPGDANALMDLSTIVHLTGKRDIGLSLQDQALQIQKVFRLQAAIDQPCIRLLVIVIPGDLTENNAVEFLVEESDITLEMLYVSSDGTLPSNIPEHDLVMVAVAEYDRNRLLLKKIEGLLSDWPCPVVNAAGHIARLSRDSASALISSVPGVVMPMTARIDAETLERIGRGESSISDVLEHGKFPVIVRPVDSHKGQGLARLDNANAIAGYLQSQPGREFFMARFIDYRNADGLYRKYRIVLIDGKPYVCHVAVSEHWIVNYMSAGMTDSAAKRAEEAYFMATFDEDFADRHAEAFNAISDRIQLEYVGIDCGETKDGELLIFEFDAAMTVHAMDPVNVFPYKKPQMRKVFSAFREMLLRRLNPGSA